MVKNLGSNYSASMCCNIPTLSCHFYFQNFGNMAYVKEGHSCCRSAEHAWSFDHVMMVTWKLLV